jgi:hypothetical protein
MSEKVRVPSPLEGVEFLSKGIPPPSNVYLSKDDSLFITVYNGAPSASCVARGRLLLANGEVKPIEFTVRPTSDYIPATRYFPLGEGFLLNLTAFGAGSIGQNGMFAIIGIARGLSSSAVQHTLLLSGYLSSQTFMGWPGNVNKSSFEGPGYVRGVTGTDPAAGTDWAEQGPSGLLWRLVSIRATLTADANAANRRVRFRIHAGGSVFFSAAAPIVQTANQTKTYVIAQGTPFETSPDVTVVGLPLPSGLNMPTSYSFDVVTENLQAGDDWSDLQYMVEEWINT